MKNAMITSAGILVLVLAMATSALGRQSVGDTMTMSQAVRAPAEHATLQVTGSGVVSGVGGLPSTSTQTSDGMTIALFALGSVLLGIVLVRKAVLDN